MLFEGGVRPFMFESVEFVWWACGRRLLFGVRPTFVFCSERPVISLAAKSIVVWWAAANLGVYGDFRSGDGQ